jgi:hypothetical protein
MMIYSKRVSCKEILSVRASGWLKMVEKLFSGQLTISENARVVAREEISEIG